MLVLVGGCVEGVDEFSDLQLVELSMLVLEIGINYPLFFRYSVISVLTKNSNLSSMLVTSSDSLGSLVGCS